MFGEQASPEARAASQSHTRAGAEAAVQQAIHDGLRSTRNCRPTHLDPGFVSGGVASVQLHCEVSWKDLGFLDIQKTIRVDAEGHAPIDTYRSTR